jgi:hypothetical protein
MSEFPVSVETGRSFTTRDIGSPPERTVHPGAAEFYLLITAETKRSEQPQVTEHMVAGKLSLLFRRGTRPQSALPSGKALRFRWPCRRVPTQ